MARTLVPFAFDPSFPTAHSFADPFLQLHREMNRVFDDALRGFGATGAGAAALGSPRMNVSESDDALHVEAELPGVSEKDVNVELNDDVLTIRGEKKTSREDKNLHVVERSFGSFSRSVRLPFSVSPDEVQAQFENGVLTITLPKAAAQQKTHRIQVQSGSGPKMVEGMSRDGGKAAPASGDGAGRGMAEKGGKAAEGAGSSGRAAQ